MIYEIFKQLRATNSKLEKLAILKSNVDCYLLQRVFVAAFDPMITYYMKKVPEASVMRERIDLIDTFAYLDTLANRKVTGNAAIEMIGKVRGMLDDGDREVFDCMLTRDIKCGVSEKTINKVWPDLIEEFPCQLCHGYDDKTQGKISYPAHAQIKADGMRFFAVCVGGEVEFRSRNGKILDFLGELVHEYNTLAIKAGCDVVFDGELVIYEKDGTLMPRQKSNGICGKASKGTISLKEAKSITTVLWDIIDHKDFKAKKSNVPCGVRYERLMKIVDQACVGSRVATIDTVTVHDEEQAVQLFQTYLDRGLEGIILKNLSSPWESKRVKHQLKMKAELECDLEISEWQFGTKGTKNEKLLGTLVGKTSCSLLTTGVGSGFSKKQRETIGPEVVGDIMAVKYNCKIRDKKTGQWSLFLPIFVEIRIDKSTADSLEDIE